MASSCHNVIDDCVKRCANRENHTSEPSLERTDDTDPSGGSHLKKREQHSGRNLPGLPPSEAYGTDLTTDSSPSEYDDETDAVAAHASECDMESAQGTVESVDSHELANRAGALDGTSVRPSTGRR
ncbi:hypothetical protein HPB51_018716 [Rhipicephalus microplus]|uniref:Uncharacterized protein n=1 Tax=Rhipicephalus microplus TaxID=6941 RepID=A0A9J6DIR8_RHIMP|nr:hypothetical protein HPB51_018716 [Rhipicephalus microplus]